MQFHHQRTIQVARDLQTGQERVQPTGSGFWTVEPSLTVIWPSDPAVLFANIGYQWNLRKSVDTIIQDNVGSPGTTAGITTTRRTITKVNDVDPGDAIEASFGVGFGLNDAVSMSFGYSHAWVLGTSVTETQTEYDQPGTLLDSNRPFPAPNPANLVTGIVNPLHSKSRSADAQIGSLLIGSSVSLNQHFGFNINVAAGVTKDAPDVVLTIRTPLSYGLPSWR